MFKLKIHTLGCKVNQYDSAMLENILCEDSHFMAASKSEKPDILIVNTCAVTKSAGAQARQEIRKLKRKYPDSKLFVFGCYARVNKQEIEELDAVDSLIVSKEPAEIYDSIRKTLKVYKGKTKSNKFLTNFPSHTRAFLKIQDGCNSFCTYCIVPFARGKPQSMPVSDVLEQINIFQESGFKEVVLSGVHLGMYGKDLGGDLDLLSLLQNIEHYSPIRRIRLSSIEPDEFTDELIDFVSGSTKILNHIHLPLQSADEKILKLMNRKYSPEFFKGRIQKISEKIPGCAIGLDVIAGFPGEGEREFQNTYNMLTGIPLSYMHVFPFSLREGTQAEKLTSRVNSKIIKRRCAVLRELGSQKKMQFRKSMIGNVQSVLIEEDSEQGTFAKGLTRNYAPVIIAQEDSCLKRNSEINVRIEGIAGEILFGKEEKER